MTPFVPDKIIRLLAARFARYSAIEKAVLFGSRARGDHTERSDYDVAVYGHLTPKEQVELRHFCSEELPTLHKIDLIFMQETLPANFVASIAREGIVIYG